MNAVNTMEYATTEKGKVNNMESPMQYRTMMSMAPRNGANMNLGREKLPWTPDI